MKVERDIAASAERVWAVITDLEQKTRVIAAITSLERLDEGVDFAVGTRWSETRVMFRRSSTEVMEVTAIDEGRSFTMESDASGAHYTSVISVEPSGDGSVISMSFEGEATSVVTRFASILGKLFEGSTRKALQQDLDDIAVAAEKVADSGAATADVGPGAPGADAETPSD